VRLCCAAVAIPKDRKLLLLFVGMLLFSWARVNATDCANHGGHRAGNLIRTFFVHVRKFAKVFAAGAKLYTAHT
jgi:hypothetical protein